MNQARVEATRFGFRFKKAGVSKKEEVRIKKKRPLGSTGSNAPNYKGCFISRHSKRIRNKTVRQSNNFRKKGATF